MSRRILVWVLALGGALWLAGCGDSDQRRLSNGTIALSSNNPAEALRLADLVLRNKPGQPEALLLKARAQMQLRNLIEAADTLDYLLATQPTLVKAHRDRVTLAFHRMGQMLARSEFPTNAKFWERCRYRELPNHPDDLAKPEGERRRGAFKDAKTGDYLATADGRRVKEDTEKDGIARALAESAPQEEYAKAYKEGLAEAQWLAEHEKAEVEANYLRGRFAWVDARYRLRHLFAVERAKLPGGENASMADLGVATKELLAQYEGRLDEAEGYLRKVSDADPRHFEGADLYAAVLLERTKWDELMKLAERMASQKGLPPTNASQLVEALVYMPDATHPLPPRLELGWKLQGAVAEDKQNTALWRTASALLHLRDGKSKEAQALLEKALALDPADGKARFLLAQAYYGQKEFPKARAILERLATESQRGVDIQLVYLWYGQALLQVGEKAMAKEALRKAVDLNPNNAAVQQAWISVLATEGDLSLVERDIDDAYQKHPDDPHFIRPKLQLDKVAGRRDAVGQVIDRVAAIRPRSAGILAILYDGYMFMKQYPQAEAAARELVKALGEEQVKSPERQLDAQRWLALALLAQRKDDQVRVLLAQLHRDFPGAGSVSLILGNLYLQQQQYDRAVELLKEAVAADKKNHDAHLKLAQAYASLSLPDDALTEIQQVEQDDPNNMEVHRLRAAIYRMTGRAAEADDEFAKINESAVKENEYPALLAELKLLKVKDKDKDRDLLQEAENVCLHALAVGNTDPTLRLLLVNIYTQKGDGPKAERQLLDLVNTQPNNAQVYAMLGGYYQQSNQVDQGLDQLKKLTTLNEPLVTLTRASLLARKGALDDAARELLPVLQNQLRQGTPLVLALADALARIQIARTKDLAAGYAVYDLLINAKVNVAEATLRQIDLTTRKDGPEATIAKLDKLAATLSPDQKRLRYEVMRRFAGLGKFDRSLAVLDQWLKDQPDNPALLLWKGQLQLEMDAPAAAIATLREAVKAAPERPLVRDALAKAHLAQFDYPAAQAVYQEMVQADPAFKAPGLAALGELYLNLGLTKRASETFDEMEKAGRPKDPRILTIMGLAAMRLDKTQRATELLKEVPLYAPQYGLAQLNLARIEQNSGRAEDARKRLKDLQAKPATAALATQEMLALDFRNPQEGNLLRWADEALNAKSLAPALRLRWLNVRLLLADQKKDWKGALATVEEMATLVPDQDQLIAARIVLNVRLGKPDDARALCKNASKFASSPFGPLAAVAVGEKPATVVDYPAFPALLVALATGDLDAARAAAARPTGRKNVFRSDLLEMLARPDAKSPEMAAACKQLATAMIAVEAGLPQLCIELSQDVLKSKSTLIPAYSLLGQATVVLGLPIDPVTVQAKDAMPASSLYLWLSSTLKMSMRDADGASQDLQRLLQREADNPDVLYRLTQTLYMGSHADEAIPILEKIVAQPGPYQIPASNDLAYLLAEKQPARLDEAAKIAAAAFKDSPRTLALLDTLGWIEHLQHNDAKALEHLRQAIPGLRAMPEAHYHLGAVYQALGNQEWARLHLEQAATGPADKPEVAKAKALLAKRAD